MAERSGLVLMCDHTYCYTPAVRQIRQFIQAGEIGEVQFVDSVRINLGLVQLDVDVLWDLTPHNLSILDFVLPEDVVPVATADHTCDPIGAGRGCLAYLSVWPSTGALAHVHVNWLSPTKIRTTVFGGSRRTIVWDDTNLSAPLMVHGRGVDRVPAGSLALDDRRQALISYRASDTHVLALPEQEALRSVLSEFASAIRDRRSPLTSARAGIRVHELLEAASRSADNGGMRIPVSKGRQLIKGQSWVAGDRPGDIGPAEADVTADQAVDRASTPSWDSLKHIELLFSLEDACDVRFDREELIQLDSLDAIVTSVERNRG
jgi:predicted dehydrogenase/acyl carrier protein